MSAKLLTGFLLFTASGLVLAIDPPSKVAAAAPTYSATLKWTIPVLRADGSPLQVGELAGYQIYYAADNPAISGIYNVSGGTAASYVASNLAAGNYYFTISAINIFGLKSAMSNMVAIRLGP